MRHQNQWYQHPNILGPTLLSFRDMTTDGQQMTEGPTSATNPYLALKTDQQ